MTATAQLVLDPDREADRRAVRDAIRRARDLARLEHGLGSIDALLSLALKLAEDRVRPR